jgi:hypothetical protein
MVPAAARRSSGRADDTVRVQWGEGDATGLPVGP